MKAALQSSAVIIPNIPTIEQNSISLGTYNVCGVASIEKRIVKKSQNLTFLAAIASTVDKQKNYFNKHQLNKKTLRKSTYKNMNQTKQKPKLFTILTENTSKTTLPIEPSLKSDVSLKHSTENESTHRSNAIGMELQKSSAAFISNKNVAAKEPSEHLPSNKTPLRSTTLTQTVATQILQANADLSAAAAAILNDSSSFDYEKTSTSSNASNNVISSSSSSKIHFQIPTDILDDLASRFIINVPDVELNNLIRICFQIELAHWFYLDFFCCAEQTLKLPTISIKPFAIQVFQHIPFLRHHLPTIDNIFEDWKNYKLSVPTYGAILVSEDLKFCLLVQSYFAKSSWGFPKGKVNENEDPVHCATREVYEETGYDITEIIKPDDYVEAVVNFQYTRLYIVRNVSMKTQFSPRTRNEIKCCDWFPIDLLPVSKYDAISKNKLGINANSFFMIMPFIKRLKKWVNDRRSISPTNKSNEDSLKHKVVDHESSLSKSSSLKDLSTSSYISSNIELMNAVHDKENNINNTNAKFIHQENAASNDVKLQSTFSGQQHSDYETINATTEQWPKSSNDFETVNYSLNDISPLKRFNNIDNGKNVDQLSKMNAAGSSEIHFNDGNIKQHLFLNSQNNRQNEDTTNQPLNLIRRERSENCVKLRNRHNTANHEKNKDFDENSCTSLNQSYNNSNKEVNSNLRRTRKRAKSQSQKICAQSNLPESNNRSLNPNNRHSSNAIQLYGEYDCNNDLEQQSRIKYKQQQAQQRYCDKQTENDKMLIQNGLHVKNECKQNNVSNALNSTAVSHKSDNQSNINNRAEVPKPRSASGSISYKSVDLTANSVLPRQKNSNKAPLANGRIELKPGSVRILKRTDNHAPASIAKNTSTQDKKQQNFNNNRHEALSLPQYQIEPQAQQLQKLNISAHFVETVLNEKLAKTSIHDKAELKHFEKQLKFVPSSSSWTNFAFKKNIISNLFC